jgi:ATP-dependent protease ClpP protease subunit
MKKQGIFAQAVGTDGKEQIIDVVGVIGWEVGFQQLKTILAAIPQTVERVIFDIYSPGGDVWEGNAIIHEIGLLRQHTVARVQVAASMATLIAVACKERVIAANGRFLVHNAWTQTQGDAEAHEKRAKELRDCEAEAAKFYAERTGKTPAEMLALMAEERWLTADETVAFGFATAKLDPFKADDFEAVRQEIVAAGKWPQALVVIPPKAADAPAVPVVPDEPDEPAAPVKHGKCADCGYVQAAVNPPCEKCGGQNVTETDEPLTENDNDATANGTTGDASGKVKLSAEAILQVQELTKAYERGWNDGEAIGRASATTELSASVEKLTALQASETKRANLRHSDWDKAKDALAQLEKTSGERINALTAQLNQVTARLGKFVDAAAAFSPAVETWEDAIRTCGGDQAKAARDYPELRKQYNQTHKSKE